MAKKVPWKCYCTVQIINGQHVVVARDMSQAIAQRMADDIKANGGEAHVVRETEEKGKFHYEYVAKEGTDGRPE